MPAPVQPLDRPPEGELGAHAAVGAVVHVARDHHEGGIARQRQVDQGLQRAQRGVAQQAGDPGVDALDPLERRIEMEVERRERSGSARPAYSEEWVGTEP